MVIRPRSRRTKSERGICQDCRVVLTDVNWTPYLQKHRRYMCGTCWSKRQNAYQNTPENKLKKKAYEARKLVDRTPEQKAKEREKNYERWIKKTYGIMLYERASMLEKQGGGCAICGSKNPFGKGVFHIDHCHSTDKIRGLLCYKCNTLLGHSRDDPEILLKAIAYLSNNPRPELN